MDQGKKKNRFLLYSTRENRLDRAGRTRNMLKSVLVVIISILAIYLLVRSIHDFRFDVPEIALLSILLVIIFAYILLRKGYFVASSVITILVTFSGMTFISLTSMGIRDAGVLSYLVMIFFTALILGKLASLIITLMSIAAIWVMIYFENNELLVYDPWSIEMIARDYTFIFLVAMVLSVFYDSVLGRYIKDLKDSRADYRKINSKLSTQNQSILKINEELRIAKEKAEESDRLKTAFLANLSHEIRTPMNSFVGFSELVLSSEVDITEKEDYNSIIAKSCKQLLGVVNDIIDISKIESGTIEMNLESINLNKLMQEIYDLHSYSAKKKNLEFNMTRSLKDDEAGIKSDPVKLQQIITNLISNALKFTSNGSVKFGYSIKNNELLFYVSDTGIGINPENHNIVFERFLQENDGLTRNHGGTGLGLSIAKAYVEELGGKIWLESEINRGSRFLFSIPYISVNLPEPATEQKIPAQGSASMRVLVVEDEETNELLLREMLKKYNFSIVYARTGEQAIQLLAEDSDFGMILMDIKLPGMDGYEATRIIRSQNKLIPIIAQTAHGFSSDREKAIAAGCSDFITKPIVQQTLDEAIRGALD